MKLETAWRVRAIGRTCGEKQKGKMDIVIGRERRRSKNLRRGTKRPKF